MFIKVNITHPGFARPAIINLEMIREVCPLNGGGCHVYFHDGDIPVTVSENFSMFEQHVWDHVSEEDITKRFPKDEKVKETNPALNRIPIPKL